MAPASIAHDEFRTELFRRPRIVTVLRFGNHHIIVVHFAAGGRCTPVRRRHAVTVVFNGNLTLHIGTSRSCRCKFTVSTVSASIRTSCCTGPAPSGSSASSAASGTTSSETTAASQQRRRSGTSGRPRWCALIASTIGTTATGSTGCCETRSVETSATEASLQAATASGAIGEGFLLPRWICDEPQHIAQRKTRGLRLFLLAEDLGVIVYVGILDVLY